MCGDYRDKADESTMEMGKDTFLLKELEITLQDPSQIFANSKARSSIMLSEARSNLSADREGAKAKEMQELGVDKAYLDFVKLCCEDAWRRS